MRASILALLVVACSAGAPAQGVGIDVDRALGHARTLIAIGPRPGESDAAKRAAAYVESALPHGARSHVGTVDLPEIRVLGTVYRFAHRTLTSDPNLVARYGPPAGKALLVMAHYDTVRSSAGALDNAVAVGVALELARLLEASPPPMPVIVAITAREEDGLIGSEALAAELGAEVDFAISLDVVGGDGDLVLNGASTLIGRAEMSWLADAADRAGVALRAPLAHRVISRWWPQAERSDHGPFTRRGIRAVHFYNRGHDGEHIDRAYHTRFDNEGRIDRAHVAEIGRLLHALTTVPPPAHAGDGFWIPQLANVVVPRWTLLAFEIVLVLVAIALLVRMRRERARGGAGLLVGAACVAVAFAGVYALERVALAAHPLAWLHAPAYFAIAEALVLAGVIGLASLLVARVRPWIGARRYLVVAIVTLLVFGLFTLAVGAAELAWIWLVPAACAGAAPALGRARIVAVLPTLLPTLLVLAPAQLREAAWNGFAPPGMPLVGWVLLVGVPPIAALAYALRERRHSGPLGTFVLPLGWALAITIGTVMEIRYNAPCSALRFHELHLTCEMGSGV